MNNQSIRVGVRLAAAAAAMVFPAAAPCRAQAQSPATSTSQIAENLQIVVTAVQGTAEVKPHDNDAWQKVTAGMTLPVGCQIRTGIPGTVQFKVGEDQVCRVDRLSLVRVVQAEENKGKIKTVMGMTYGRVSKDVDEPVVPHDDTIISPTSTLAVRGTEVSLYDQPPYEPEAVSLTGKAIYTNSFKSGSVPLGAKGQGTAKVGGTSQSSASYNLQTNTVPSLISQDFLSNVNTLGQFTAAKQDGSLGTPPLMGPAELQFQLSWTGNEFSVLDFSVASPNNAGTVFTTSTPGAGFLPTATPAGNLVTANGGRYAIGVAPGIGTVADSHGFGNQEIDFGSPTTNVYPEGTYIVTETFEGTYAVGLGLTAPGAGTLVRPTLTVIEKNGPAGTFTAVSNPIVNPPMLNPATPSISYMISVPSNMPVIVKQH